jgi:hypothetical protein
MGMITLILGQRSYAQLSVEDLNRKIEAQNIEIRELRNQVSNDTFSLKQKVDNYAPLGMVLFLFGGFCALWAQNSHRSAWIWFFAGALFSIITVIVLLIKNADEKLNDRLSQ